ncbi:MAG: permease [Oscillospiraceae bacterium]|nr:permease [Oscillospiraceae bacterium]
MKFFGGVISVNDIYTLLFVVFGVLLVGYALGRITIKGVSLGDAGVFIIALLVGALCFSMTSDGLVFNASAKPYDYKAAMKIIEGLGLVLFVTSVGYIAGPKFFGNFKKNFKSYVLLGLVIILAGGLAAVGCIYAGELFGYGSTISDQDGFVAMIVGLLSGSLTSTPAFSAAKATVDPVYEGLVSVGHGISYIFGVVGVVLFVQLVPKLSKANMEEERAKLVIKTEKEEKKASAKKLFEIDHMGVAGFALAAIIGVLIGNIKIPLSSAGLSGTCFSLTATGGCLLASLILGHFGKIGPVCIMPAQSTLKLFRELGLVLFLVGAGIPGGAEFVANFDPMYFVYGIVMTIVPMIIGFLFAKYVLKLSLLNNLGSLTGGMTSTPALGTLIGVAGTEDVAAAYAATYPIALIAVVLVSQFLVILF